MKKWSIVKGVSFCVVCAFTTKALFCLYDFFKPPKMGRARRYPGGYIDIMYEYGRRNPKTYILRTGAEAKVYWTHVVNENGTDVTNEISKYAGPFYDFLGARLTPNMLGHKKLIFYKHKDVLVDFGKYECIRF